MTALVIFFLVMGLLYFVANQTFTGWIPAGTPLASDPWLQQLQGKTIKITGEQPATGRSYNTQMTDWIP